MTKDEALKLALEALVLNNAEWKHLADSGDSGDWSAEDQDHYKHTEEAITAIKEALAQQNQFNPDWDVMAVMVEEQQRMAKRIAELEAQPEQPKYRRGNRLVCLETDEYCVIHISGTDRQWVKFPDSYIGVYTNEQVAELFELLPKESEPWEKFCDSNCVWTDHHPDCKLAEQKPVAWTLLLTGENNGLVGKAGKTFEGHPEYYRRVDVYTTPPQRKPLSDERIWHLVDIHVSVPCPSHPLDNSDWVNFARAIEAAHGIKGEA